MEQIFVLYARGRIKSFFMRKAGKMKNSGHRYSIFRLISAGGISLIGISFYNVDVPIQGRILRPIPALSTSGEIEVHNINPKRTGFLDEYVSVDGGKILLRAQNYLRKIEDNALLLDGFGPAGVEQRAKGGALEEIIEGIEYFEAHHAYLTSLTGKRQFVKNIQFYLDRKYWYEGQLQS